MDQFKRDSESEAIKRRLADDTQDASQLGVTGTPAFFINGRFLSGAKPFGEFKTVIEGEGAITLARPVDGWVYLTTNLDAPNYRVLRFQPDNPARDAWQEVLAETDEKLEGIVLIGRRIFASYLKNVTSRLRVFEADGSNGLDVDLPGLGSTGSVTGEWDGSEAFVVFTSFHIPLTVLRYDMASNSLTVFTRTEVDVDMEAFDISQVWAASKDGTKVPMFVVHRKDLALDGSSPAVLTGYGGFSMSLTPFFDPLAAFWIQHGGVFASANLRGGGEYGEVWHEAGMLANKQNVFDDFAAFLKLMVRAETRFPNSMKAPALPAIEANRFRAAPIEIPVGVKSHRKIDLPVEKDGILSGNNN